MQEQPLFKVTPEAGWTTMKSILDQEMPVSRRSRRILFFWWATAAVVVLSSIGLYMMKENAIEPVILPIEQPASPQKNNKETPSSPVKDAIASAVPSQHSSQSSPTELSSNQNSKSSSHTTDIEKTKYNPDKLSSENSNVSATGNEFAQTSISNSNVQTNESLAPTILPVIGNNVVEPVRYDIRINAIVPLIPSIRATSIPLEEFSYTVHSIEPSKSKRQIPLFEPDLSVSGLIGQNGGVGAYGGVGLSVNLNRKFSITTGLGYSAFRPDATIFSSTKADLSSAPENNAILIHDSFYTGINTYIEASNVNTEAGYNEIEPLVESVNQLQVGAGVKWKFSRRFFTEAGVQIGFNTKVTSEYPIIEGDPLTGIVQGRIGNSFNSYDVVRSTMTTLYAGAGYRFGQHLDAFIQWKHGLDTYLLNDNSSGPNADLGGERSDYIRGLNLGLRYVL